MKLIKQAVLDNDTKSIALLLPIAKAADLIYQAVSILILKILLYHTLLIYHIIYRKMTGICLL